MLSFRPVSLAVLASLALTPAAFAQDASNATSAKRFSIAGGYAHLVPKHDPGKIAGSESKIHGQGAPTLSATYMATDNIGVELWGMADKIDHKVTLANGARGSLKQQPVALSGQYHFGQPSQALRPYVGLGYYESNISDEQLEGAHFGASTPKGGMATAGVDFNITDRWFTRADARYMKGDSDIKVGGAKVGEVDLDPLTVGVSVGTRF